MSTEFNAFIIFSFIKKYYLAKISFILIVFYFFLFFPLSQIHASILLNDDFTSSYSGYTTSFGTCLPGSDGLKCNNAVGITNNNFPGFKCVEGIYNLSENSSIGGNIIIAPNNNSLGNLVNIVFKNNSNIVLNYTFDNDIGFGHWDTGTLTPIGEHIYTLCKIDNKFLVYLDNSKIFEQTITGFSGEHVGFQVAINDILTNFKVTDTLPANDAFKFVPLLKQTSDPWQGLEYDTASKWSPSNSTINRWGCALTSAAMVFQYHGYLKLPDGTSLDPGSLNTWLKSQRDGYIGNGLVNWNALTRLSKLSKMTNNITEFDALEFSRRPVNNSLLESDLTNKNPIILSQPGHFVVATEKLPTTFAIHDPFHNRSSLSDGYNNTYLSLNRFIPSNTDLSTILITSPISLNINVKDSDGISIGSSYIQQAISADDDPIIKSGDDVKVFTAEQPDSDSYIIEVSSPDSQIFDLTGYLYNQDGEVSEIVLSGVTNSKSNFYTLTFDKKDNSKNKLQKNVTFDSVLNELDAAYSNNKINKGMHSAIKHLVLNAQKSVNKNHILTAKVQLYTVLGLLQTPGNKLIEMDYGDILSEDLHSILMSL